MSIADTNSILEFEDGTRVVLPKYGDLKTRHRVCIEGQVGLRFSIRPDKPDVVVVESSRGAAFKAGIRQFVRILRIDGEPIRTETSLHDIVNDRKLKGKTWVTFQCLQPLNAKEGIDYIETVTDVDAESAAASRQDAMGGIEVHHQPSDLHLNDDLTADDLSPSEHEEFEDFVDRVMEVFDADHDGILNYEEHSSIFRAVGGVPYTRERFRRFRPNGFTKDEYRAVLRQEPYTNTRLFMDRMDTWFAQNRPDMLPQRRSDLTLQASQKTLPPAPMFSPSVGHSPEEERLADTVHQLHQVHPQPLPVQQSTPVEVHRSPAHPSSRDRPAYPLPPGPYPTVWGVGEEERGQAVGGGGGVGSERVISVDLRVDSNHALKRAVLLCSRELEKRLVEAKACHDSMEQGLVQINREAVTVFGADLNTLLQTPHKRDMANEWAAQKMQEIDVPPKLLAEFYEAHASGPKASRHDTRSRR